MVPSTITDATVYLELTVPAPWPPAVDVFLGRIETLDAAAEFVALSEGRLLIRVKDAYGADVHELKSRPLNVGTAPWFKLAAAWDRGGLRAFTDGQTLYGESGDLPIRLLDRQTSSGASHTEVEEARHKRQELVHRPVRDGCLRLPRDDLRAALRAELDQLDDIFELIFVGRRHHVRGLAARLRLLIATPTRMSIPLLQLVAAHDDQHLPVRASPNLDGLSDASFISPSQAAPASIGEAGSTDLDHWLTSIAARVNGNVYTQNQVLRAVSDTIGAHHDPDVEPLVEELRKHLSGAPSGSLSALDLWLLSLAYTVATLGRDLLDKP